MEELEETEAPLTTHHLDEHIHEDRVGHHHDLLPFSLHQDAFSIHHSITHHDHVLSTIIIPAMVLLVNEEFEEIEQCTEREMSFAIEFIRSTEFNYDPTVTYTA